MRGRKFVKAKALLLFVSFACLPTVNAFGQVDCNTSHKLVCQFPFNAQTLAVFNAGSSSATALDTAAEAVSVPINASIATQLTQLPIPSSTVGVVTLQQKDNPLGVPFENLGPVLTDRPDTVGKGHLFIGFSYQHFNFNSLNGHALGTIPIGFTYTSGSTTSPISNYDAVSNRVSFKLDQYIAVATYGITRRSDLTLVVPVNSASLDVTTDNFQGYQYANGIYGTITSPTTTVYSSGSASGVGDVTLSFKQLLIGGEGTRTAIAAGVVVRFSSGDALNYLGSGAFGGNIYGLVEYRARVAPHLKISYQYNNDSQVMNLQKSSNTRLPGGIQYDLGADARVNRHLTLAGDLLGSQFVDVPAFTLGTLTLPGNPAASGITATTIPNTTSAGTNTYTTVNVSGGLKLAIGKHFIFYGNALKQTNNVGLRSDVVPQCGMAFKM